MMQIRTKPIFLLQNMANLDIKKLEVFKADPWDIMKGIIVYMGRHTKDKQLL